MPSSCITLLVINRAMLHENKVMHICLFLLNWLPGCFLLKDLFQEMADCLCTASCIDTCLMNDHKGRTFIGLP